MSRLVTIVAAAVLLAGGAAALALIMGSRDEPGLAASAGGPGRAFADQCAEHRTRPRGFRFSSDPPTSGPHRPVRVTRDGARLSTDQLLHALELGNVVLAYDASRPPARLRALQDDVAGPFDPQLAAAGQAIVLARVRGTGSGIALAWRHSLNAASPELRAFAEHWLGRGVDSARCP